MDNAAIRTGRCDAVHIEMDIGFGYLPARSRRGHTRVTAMAMHALALICAALAMAAITAALAASQPQVLPFTAKGRQSFLGPMNALRAKPPAPAVPALTPAGYNLEFETGLVQLVNNLTGAVFWKNVYNIWDVLPRGALLDKFRGKGWDLYLRDSISTKPGGLGVGWNFRYRIKQAPCFNYTQCSTTHYTEFASCASTLATNHPNMCPHWALYYPRYMLSSPPFQLGCVITHYVADPTKSPAGHATLVFLWLHPNRPLVRI